MVEKNIYVGNVYFGYDIRRYPKIGEKLVLTKVEVGGCSLGPMLDKEQLEIGPIEDIEQISQNMSILWTEDAGYAVYWVPRS